MSYSLLGLQFVGWSVPLYVPERLKVKKLRMMWWSGVFSDFTRRYVI